VLAAIVNLSPAAPTAFVVAGALPLAKHVLELHLQDSTIARRVPALLANLALSSSDASVAVVKTGAIPLLTRALHAHPRNKDVVLRVINALKALCGKPATLDLQVQRGIGAEAQCVVTALVGALTGLTNNAISFGEEATATIAADASFVGFYLTANGFLQRELALLLVTAAERCLSEVISLAQGLPRAADARKELVRLRTAARATANASV
jgi:hypothetical protein